MRLLPLLVVTLAVFAALTTAEAVETEWLFGEADYAAQFKTFISNFKKSIASTKLPQVLLNFKRSVDAVANLVKQKLKFKVGITRFADLSESEFLAQQRTRPPKSLKKAALLEGSSEPTFVEMSNEVVAENFATGFDWAAKNVLTPVRNQLACGSCWSFAAALTLEAAVAIGGGKKAHVSPQAFVDCVPRSEGCLGCKGGWASCAYDYSKTTGFFAESDIPYQNKEATCSTAGKTPVGKVAEVVSTGYMQTTDAKLQQMVQVNPLWSTVFVGKVAMFYKGGIMDHVGANCTGREINHAVVVVGYGQENGVNYYKIRNSWGGSGPQGWGEDGYFRIKADGKACGLYTWGVHRPTIKK